ncbi:MAG: hypothetical protein AB1650_00485 [Candidatus Omnitrophota bacterium]
MFKKIWGKHPYILLLAILAALIFNLTMTVPAISSSLKKISSQPYVFIGRPFIVLRDILGNVSKVGYVTDGSMDDLSVAAKFAVAQYTLAPVILELNETDLPFVIYNYSSPLKALNEIKQEGMVMIGATQNGFVLASNPDRL